MPAKKKAAPAPKLHPAAEFVAENGTDGFITAEQLAELVSRSGKSVRARLRKIGARDQKKVKGARWLISVTLAESEFDHYAALDAEPEEEAS